MKSFIFQSHWVSSIIVSTSDIQTIPLSAIMLPFIKFYTKKFKQFCPNTVSLSFMFRLDISYQEKEEKQLLWMQILKILFITLDYFRFSFCFSKCQRLDIRILIQKNEYITLPMKLSSSTTFQIKPESYQSLRANSLPTEDHIKRFYGEITGKTQLSGLRGEVPQDKWLRTKGRRDKEKNKEVKAEPIDIKEVWDIPTNCNMWNLFVIKKLLLILLRQWYYDYIFINYIKAYFKIIHGLPWWLSTK